MKQEKCLRHFFLEDRSLLNCLFQAVRSVILKLFHKMNKGKNFVPGFVCVLHTFGRPLEWNPHIHCLLTEGAFSDDGFWRTVKYFNFIQLLIQHIPEKHFKMTRYYGLYARHREIDKTLHKAIDQCKHKMVFLELYHNHKRVPLDELYEKAMAPYRYQSKSPPGKKHDGF